MVMYDLAGMLNVLYISCVRHGVCRWRHNAATCHPPRPDSGAGMIYTSVGEMYHSVRINTQTLQQYRAPGRLY